MNQPDQTTLIITALAPHIPVIITAIGGVVSTIVALFMKPPEKKPKAPKAGQ